MFSVNIIHTIKLNRDFKNAPAIDAEAMCASRNALVAEALTAVAFNVAAHQVSR